MDVYDMGTPAKGASGVTDNTVYSLVGAAVSSVNDGCSRA